MSAFLYPKLVFTRIAPRRDRNSLCTALFAELARLVITDCWHTQSSLGTLPHATMPLGWVVKDAFCLLGFRQDFPSET